MENKWGEIRQARYARLESAPAAHRIRVIMGFAKSARSTSRASALSQQCRGLRAAAFGRGTADDAACGVVDCGIFRKLPCLQTRYIVESASDASLGAEIDPAQPLASVRGRAESRTSNPWFSLC